MKKIFCLVLVICMLSTFTNVKAESDKTLYPIVLEKNNLYLNGNSVVFKKDTTGNICAYDVTETSKLLEDKLNSSLTIYGGAKNKSVNASYSILLEGVNFNQIYGGGYSDGSAPANVNGNVSIKLTGNVDAKTIYGGGYALAQNGNAQADVNGNVVVAIEAKPTTNHNNITLGGYAYTNTNYRAQANISGNLSLNIIGRTYAVRGGGSASTGSSSQGTSQADVLGNINMLLSAVDVREVYGGGYASNHSQANVQNINIEINNKSEVMIIEGGGHASNNSIANANNVNISLIDCINIYGYVYGGGYAYKNSTTNVQNVKMNFRNSIIPADTQFGNIVAAGIYGGGKALESSTATAKKVTIEMYDTETAGTIYSGGTASIDSNAVVGEAIAYYENIVGNTFNNVLYKSTVIAQGDSENEDVAKVGTSSIILKSSKLDGVWGGGENKGNPIPMNGKSNLNVLDNHYVETIANFDTITYDASIHAKKIMGKTTQIPTKLIVKEGVLVGTPLVYCDNIDNMEKVFKIDNDKLDYIIKDNISVWSLGQMTYDIKTKSNSGGRISCSQIVNKYQNITITWEANNEYQVENILLDGKVIQTKDNSYTFNKVITNHTLEVTFKKIPGQISDKVEVESKPDTPKTNVDVSKDKIEQLLNEEDKVAIADGKSIQYEVVVDKVKSIPKVVAEAIEKVINKENILMNLNIDLLKNIDGEKSNISNANAKIRIVIEIPQEYLNRVGDKKFAILRTHLKEDGTYESVVLEDLDDNDKTITFETNQFSLYSLIFDLPKEPDLPIVVPPSHDDVNNSEDNNNQGQNNAVKTEDNSQVLLYLSLFVIAGVVVIEYIISKKKNYNNVQ